MTTIHDLLDDTNTVFERLATGLRRWPDPHESRSPSGEEYSVVTGATKWRIIGMRVNAWFEVLEERELARIEHDVTLKWVEVPGTRICRVDRAVPEVSAALPLVVARSMVGDVEDAGITVGIGDPATPVTWVPDCGCDACDHGSQTELNRVDRIITSAVSGRFRRLDSGARTITQLDETSWSATGFDGNDDIDRILESPSGWNELSGRSWLR